MKRKYTIKKKHSLKENLRAVIPEMFDDFDRFRPVVVNFPLRKNMLHEMRKAGKPLRYAMELGEYAFGADFTLCLEEIKSSLDLMGDIHDADVMIPDIELHMKEIRQFNNSVKECEQRILTLQLRETLTKLRSSRKALYAELCQKLNLWAENDFRQRIVYAMMHERNIHENDLTEENNYSEQNNLTKENNLSEENNSAGEHGL